MYINNAHGRLCIDVGPGKTTVTLLFGDGILGFAEVSSLPGAGQLCQMVEEALIRARANYEETMLMLADQGHA